MPKIKTHKATAKRFKVTATGKVVRHHSGKRHILTKKSRSRKRRLRHGVLVDESDQARFQRLLPTHGVKLHPKGAKD